MFSQLTNVHLNVYIKLHIVEKVTIVSKNRLDIFHDRLKMKKLPLNEGLFPYKEIDHQSTVRIVCISDTHNRFRELRVPEGDILIHAGDITRRG